MSSRTAKLTIGIFLAVVLIVAAFGVGYRLGKTPPPAGATGGAVLDQAWNIIFTDYVDQSKLDEKALSHAGIQGILKQLNDPHTAFLETQDYQPFITGLEGQFEGIGAMVSIADGQATVVAPLPGSPAEQAGIQPGDVIVEVDGKPTKGMSLSEVVNNVRGPRGTTVKLLILHRSQTTPVLIEVKRDKVTTTTVHYEVKGDYAYIDISQFSERTDVELIPVIQAINESQAKGIILDLRGNPGGILQTVVDNASHFIKEGVVVKVVSNHAQETSRSIQPTDIRTDLPMVVLTDNNSASGSEVLAGALQDYGRATIAGTTTFGKGSVNILRQLADGSGIYITTARWATPKGRLIEGKGIDPDYPLTLQGDEAIQWAIDFLQGKR